MFSTVLLYIFYRILETIAKIQFLRTGFTVPKDAWDSDVNHGSFFCAQKGNMGRNIQAAAALHTHEIYSGAENLPLSITKKFAECFLLRTCITVFVLYK